MSGGPGCHHITLCCIVLCQGPERDGMQIRAVIESVSFALYQPCDAYLVGIKWLVRSV